MQVYEHTVEEHQCAMLAGAPSTAVTEQNVWTAGAQECAAKRTCSYELFINAHLSDTIGSYRCSPKFLAIFCRYCRLVGEATSTKGHSEAYTVPADIHKADVALQQA